MLLALGVLALGVLAAPLSASGPAPIPETANWAKTDNLTALGFAPRFQPPNSFNTDLAFWGDVAIQGSFTGFRFVDISKPQKPKQIFDYNGCAGDQGDVIVWDNILVRSWNSPAGASSTCGGQPVPQGQEGLHVFDISDMTDPQLRAFIPLRCGSHTATGVPDLANDRLLVYNSSSSSACPGFDVVQVPLGNPAGASLVREVVAEMACHDIGVIMGGVMKLACAGHFGVQVYGIGAPAGGSLDNPQFLWMEDYPGVTIGHSAMWSFDGKVLVLGHEPGGGVQARCQETSELTDRTLYFVDGSNGAILGTFIHPRPQTATENCSWHNYNIVPLKNKAGKPRYVMVSGNYQSGISVVDFSDPAAPEEIAFADPPPLSPTQLILGGDWGSYWYNGRIYQSDITRGLFIWRIDDPRVGTFFKTTHLNPQTAEFSIGS
ncbi:MAG TPA: hypothetical protein VK915_11695 [Gaiellaceae bacterium]|nr:hypothetical protein [Gaiellaceae bacterium]